MAEIRRTVVVKLDVDDSDATLLHETVEEYLWACNYVVRDAWQDDYKPTSKTTLHERTYSAVRDETRLQANLVQSARNKAAEAISGVVARWKNGKKASQPHFTTPSVRYDKRSATFHDDYVSLSTVNGRVEAEYVLPPEGENPHKKFHAWAFRRLYDYVAYKAEAEGIEVTQIDPAYTSQRCSQCGTTLRENRPSQAEFCCQKCGYEANADYNAAKNIGFNMLRAGQKSPHGGATRHLALKSGTLNVNGEYSPAE